jgi:hypothetical protein
LPFTFSKTSPGRTPPRSAPAGTGSGITCNTKAARHAWESKSHSLETRCNEVPVWPVGQSWAWQSGRQRSMSPFV